MNRLVFTVIFCLTGWTLKGQSQLIPPNDPSVQYVGRFDFTDPAEPVFMYSGCLIKTGFTGTSISVKLIDDSLRNWFTVKLDDSVFTFKADKANGMYKLAAALKNGRHSIEISRRTEWHGGNTRFQGFVIDENEKPFALPKQGRSIEFIGNSLTCGYGNEGSSREEHFKYETENSYLTYGALVSRAVKADYVFVCRSGIGMYQDYAGDTNFVQPKRYDEIVTGSRAVWDYEKNQPDIVVIELGANDLNKPLDSSAFANSYTRFIEKIRKQYKQAKIICAAGPDLPGGKNSRFQSYLKAITAQFAGTDDKVYYFYFGITDANGSNWHPNVKEHRQMANALLPFVKSIAKW